MNVTINFLQTALALVFLLLAFLCRKFFGRPKDPYFLFSSVSFFTKSSKGKGMNFLALMKVIILCSIALAMSDLTVVQKGNTFSHPTLERVPQKGLALYLVLDQSSSMEREVYTESYGILSLMELLKKMSEAFVLGVDGLAGRTEDLIGVVSFARVPKVQVPLTFDQAQVVQGLEKIQTVQDKDKDGTGIGYAVYKTAHLIDQVQRKTQQGGYEIRHSAIVLVTDGLQTTHPQDLGDEFRSISLDDAAVFAKQTGTRLYLVTLFPEILEERYAPERRQLARVAKSTGGKLFPIVSPDKLADVFKEIDQIEKTPLPAYSILTPSLRYYHTSSIFTWIAFMAALLYLIYRYGLRWAVP